MARTIKNPKVDSRNARRKLKRRREPYWTLISPGCHLGYRKFKNPGGTWIARHYDRQSKQRAYLALGPADDILDEGALRFVDAQERAREWFAEQAGHRQVDATVDMALDNYLRYLREEKSPRAYTETRSRMKNAVRPELGRIRLSQLTSQRIRDWRSGLLPATDDPEAARRAKDTVNRVMSMLRAALNRAFQDGLCESDVAWRRVKNFRGVGAARTVFLTQAQTDALLEACTGALRALVEGGIHTGARFGELAAARAGDFDAEHGVLRIRKGKTGARDVFLSSSAVRFFQRLTANRLPDQALFVRDDAQPWDRSQQARLLHKAVERAGLPEGTVFYSLRHSYASAALLRGVNHQLLAENLGTSIRMLEKHYGKFMTKDRRAAFEVMG